MKEQFFQPGHYAGVRGLNTALNRPKNPDRLQDIRISRRKARIIEPSVAITSSDLLASSLNTQRSLWPVCGAKKEVTYISISTEIALKPDFWPASSLCGSFFPPPSGGSSNDQLPFTKAELGLSLPQALLSDWQIYQILQLGLGRIMAKNHPSDLRQGVGCIRMKRPNRGRAAKIISNGAWVYGSWRSRQGRTYQLYGREGVVARMNNNFDGELRCVIQNDNPTPDDVAIYETRLACDKNFQSYIDGIPYGNFETQNSPMSSSVYPRSFPTETASGTGRVRSEPQSGLEFAQSGFTSSPYTDYASSPFMGSTGLPFTSSTNTSFTDPTSSPPTYPAWASYPVQYAQSSGQSAMGASPQQEGAYGDHLSQLEMRYPSSEIWEPLARGERRRRNATTPLDYPMQNTSTDPVPERIEHPGWPKPPWGRDIDHNERKPWTGVPAIDHGGLTGAFNLTDGPVAHVNGEDIYEMPEFEGGNTCDQPEHQGGDTYNTPPNVDGCLCEECQPVAAAETTASNPEYFRDRPVPQSLWRRHSF